MIPLALSGILIGAILGMRFTILALMPAMTCALTIGVANTVMRGGLFGPTIIELAVLLAFVQIGYLCGAAFQFSLVMQALRLAGRPDQPPNSRSIR
jgi:hypothetical protein